MAQPENPRVIVSSETSGIAVDDVVKALLKRLQQKGNSSYASNHEALGVITEEYFEYVDAVKNNDNQHVYEELVDIAVGCIFAVASMRAKKLL